MSEGPNEPRIHIDSDWKQEAAREKERLRAQEQTERKVGPEGPAEGVSFLDLVNLVAMQAAVALGGFQGPGGEQIPANPPAARHHIDLLAVLEQKTKGNLSDEEKKVLSAVLYELRMSYVHMAGGAPPAPPEGAGERPQA